MNVRKNLDSRLERYLSISPILIAFLIAAGIPAAFFTIQYRHNHAGIEVMSKIQGSLVIDAINKNPSMWQFEEHKLKALVENRVAEGEGVEGHDKNANRFSIYTLNNVLLASNSQTAPLSPVIKHDTPLFDATKKVGVYRVESSIRDIVVRTLWVFIASTLLAMYVAFSLRTLPLLALRKSFKTLRHMAHHDSLTGLPNRKLLREKLDQAIAHTDRTTNSILLLFIDLDNFKDINDSLGHSSGDELLKVLGNRMRSEIRTTDTLARLGGDEFVLLFVDLPTETDVVENLITKIRSVISEPVGLSGRIIEITSSIGLARYPEDGTTAEALLQAADVAMYNAKESGGNTLSIYSQNLGDRIQERIDLDLGIAEALRAKEFKLVYQPLVDQKTKSVVGVEALIRWHHKTLGIVPPDKFIPRAEQSGAIIDIGNWVLLTACNQNKAWQDQGFPPVIVCVNVSARQFSHDLFLSTVENALSTSQLAPKYLELEITESLIMTNVAQAFNIMEKLKTLGVKLSIDDFGTGYSSLSYLKKFPVSTLKIDKSFIDGIATDRDDESITKVIISLGHQLNMRVVAEGVETLAQSNFLDESGCDLSQGYFFSRPVPPEQIFLRQSAKDE